AKTLTAKPARRKTKQPSAFLRRKLLLTIDPHSDGVKNMKTPRFILALFALTVAVAPQSPLTARPEPKDYSAKLISPKPGEVLVPGQIVRIQSKADFPN